MWVDLESLKSSSTWPRSKDFFEEFDFLDKISLCDECVLGIGNQHGKVFWEYDGHDPYVPLILSICLWKMQKAVALAQE